jgi:hypothetical protein
VGVDVTNTTATVSQSVDMFCRSNAGEGGVAGMAKAATSRPIPFSFPDDADFAEALMTLPDPFFLLEEEFNTASRPNSATALSSGVFSACSKTAPADALWTTGAAAQDGISWATWGMQRAPKASTVPFGAPEGSLVDAVEACLALPLDGAFIRDFCRQD